MPTSTSLNTKFPLGQIVGTPRAMRALDDARQAPWEYIIKRHGQGDWGDMVKHENGCTDGNECSWCLNDQALLDEDGGRIFSVYVLPTGVKVWVITEADRSSTCIMLPEDY